MSMTAKRYVVLLTAALTTGWATAGLAADATGCTPQERQQANQTLSQKLDDSAGVICPPDVDPAIKAPTPKGGNMPVIHPPGSPGGDPSVQPK